jgi:hypothetical protein
MSHAFALWLRPGGDEAEVSEAAEALGEALIDAGCNVESIDVAALARESYKRHKAGPGLAIALATTVLERQGIVALLYGAKHDSSTLDWGKLSPERCLDIIVGGEEVKTTPGVPTLRLLRMESSDTWDCERVVAALKKAGWIE